MAPTGGLRKPEALTGLSPSYKLNDAELFAALIRGRKDVTVY
jgi:hypothetical protein